jgi:hypothetical protein
MLSGRSARILTMVSKRRIEIVLRSDRDDTAWVQSSIAAVVMRFDVVEIDGRSDIGMLKQRGARQSGYPPRSNPATLRSSLFRTFKIE